MKGKLHAQMAAPQRRGPLSLGKAPTKLVRVPVQSVGATFNDTVRTTDDSSRTVDNLLKSLANSRLRSEAVVKNSGIVIEKAPIQDAEADSSRSASMLSEVSDMDNSLSLAEIDRIIGDLTRTPLNTEAGSPEGSHVFRTVSDPESPSGKSLSELKLSFTTRMQEAIRMQRERMRVLLNDVDSKIVSLKKEHGLNERDDSDIRTEKLMEDSDIHYPRTSR